MTLRNIIIRLGSIVFGLIGGMLLSQPAHAQESAPTALPVFIISPANVQAVQGMVSVIGTTQTPGFKSAELSFGYQDDPTHTWFLIVESAETASAGVIAEWDTTTLTDGVYQLRLIVNLEDGGQYLVKVKGIRVRNYTPIETDTPLPNVPTSTLSPGQMPPATPTPTRTASPIAPTLTPLPPNPAVITPDDIRANLLNGVVLAVLIFAVIGLYGLLRKRLREDRG